MENVQDLESLTGMQKGSDDTGRLPTPPTQVFGSSGGWYRREIEPVSACTTGARELVSLRGVIESSFLTRGKLAVVSCESKARTEVTALRMKRVLKSILITLKTFSISED